MEKKVEDFMTKSIMNRLKEYQDKRFIDFIKEQYAPKVVDSGVPKKIKNES
jgi:hypothetical protein